VELQMTNAGDIPVRDAATVIVVRDCATGPEVCMLRRNLKSDFVGGAYVFPGGGVDPQDAYDDLAPYVMGRTAESADREMEVDSGGLAFWVAAIRESFEEAGLLFAYDEPGLLVDLAHPLLTERYRRHRSDVDSGRRRLVEICGEESLRLAVDHIHTFSRWITPLGAPRRYDTRFFVAEAPSGQEAIHDDREVIATVWITPEEALARHERGEFELIFPTIRTLESLRVFSTAGEIIDHAAHIGRIPATLPRIVERDGGLRIVLPGDLEFDAITARPLEP